LIQCMIDRIKFTGICLKGAAAVYTAQKSIFGVAVCVIVLQAIWQIICLVSLFAVLAVVNESKAAGGNSQGLVALWFLSFYWGVQVFSNILHVACSGVVARWYFDSQTEDAVSKSSHQACTNYLGPIALGSLLVAIVQTLKQIVESMQRRRDEETSVRNQILICITLCCLSCIERLFEIFNTFAFVFVAIYGTSYCESGSKVYRLLACTNGLSILIQYNLASMVSGMGCFMGGVIIACINALLAFFLGLDITVIVGTALIGFITTFCIMTVVSRVVESGCDTLFVCFAEEPEKLKDSQSEIYDAFQTYMNINEE